MRVKDAIGRFGEQLAAEHLQARGLTVLERNWRCRTGELDIIALDGSTLVFAEVKTRSSLAFGSPAEALDRRKAARVRALAMVWLREQREAARSAESAESVETVETAETAGTPHTFTKIRFDAVCVLRPRSGAAVQVVHLVGAF